MNELIKIHDNGNNGKAIDARELHSFLGNKQRFNDWITYRINNYGFEAEIDFTEIPVKIGRGRPRREYILTIDMAKELAMVENNEKGRQARRYFIEVEKAYKNQTSLNPLVSIESNETLMYQKLQNDLKRESNELLREEVGLFKEYLSIKTAIMQTPAISVDNGKNKKPGLNRNRVSSV